MKARELTCGGRFGLEKHMVRMSVILLLFMTCSTVGLDAKAQCVPEELFKLLATDGAAGDYFGSGVAVSGTVGIVGAYRHSVVGTHSGAAYIFDTDTGTQTVTLHPNDGAAYDYFGHRVAVDGTMAIVGAEMDDDNGANSGSAYLFDTTTGIQLAKLLPTDPTAENMFGMTVGISGTIAIIGTPYDDANGENSGSVYLFDTTSGTQFAKLLPTDSAAMDYFGMSVAIDGTTAIIGAPYDDDNGTDSGAAYIFDTTTGTQVAKLLPADGTAYSMFGMSVEISGTNTIIGAPYEDFNGTNSGSAYLFDTTSGTQVAKLLPSDGGAENEFFGFSVSIDSDTALVGALDDDNGVRSGSAFFFDIATGDQLAKIFPADGRAEQYFGCSVAIDSAVAIIGATQDDVLGVASGAAYIFDTCSVTSQTIDAAYHCQPAAGIVPFTTQMAVVMDNLFTTQRRRFAYRINVTLADGSYYGNWRAGYRNMAEGGRLFASWYQSIPAIESMVGSNLFELVAEDVTPAPWNQPPYPPSGDTATAVCTVTGVAP